MKKNLVIAAAAVAALCMASCHGNTKSNETDKDSLSTVANDSLSSGVAIESLAGTYEGTLPAADCPGIRTVLTLNADSTRPTTWSARTATTRQAAYSRCWQTMW